MRRYAGVLTTRGALHRAAILYTLGVALAFPSVLGASDGITPPPAVPAPPAAEAPAAPGQPVPAVPEAPATAAAPAPTAKPQAEARAPAEPAAPPSAPVRPAARAAAAGSVAMNDFSFSPASVTVNEGESVTWTNNGEVPHTATGDGFDTGTVGPGASGSATFSSAGTFSYVCSLHPTMRGTVRVTSAGGGQDGGGAAQTQRGQSGAGPGAAAGSSGQAPGPAADPAQAGDTLPASGQEAWLLGALGVVLLGLGIALRRHTAYPGS